MKIIMDQLPYWIIPIKKIIITDKTKEWCGLPYPNHPKGCPNFGKAIKCPPQAPFVGDYFDLTRELYFVYSEFDLASHVKSMKEKHPTWSDLQCKCVLYWQAKNRKILKERTVIALRLLRTNQATACPEGMCVNVFATAALSGLRLDKTKAISTCRHIALIGYSLEDLS